MIFAFSPLSLVAQTLQFIKIHWYKLLGFVGIGALVVLTQYIPYAGGLIKLLGSIALFSSVIEFVVSTTHNRALSLQKIAITYQAYFFVLLSMLLAIIPCAAAAGLMLTFTSIGQVRYIICLAILCVYMWGALRVIFTPFVANDENIGSIKALGRSWYITKGTIPAQLGSWLMCSLLVVIFTCLIALTGQLLAGKALFLFDKQELIFWGDLISPVSWVFHGVFLSHMYLAIRRTNKK